MPAAPGVAAGDALSLWPSRTAMLTDKRSVPENTAPTESQMPSDDAYDSPLKDALLP